MAIEIEFGWLIEFREANRPTWWDGRGPNTSTNDANDAIRFSRKQDAERVASLGFMKRKYIITEHSWSNVHGN